jgi:iron complex outermembrane receptor protein
MGNIMVLIRKQILNSSNQMPKFKRSALALAVMACATHAYAQESEEQSSANVLEQVVVTGVRQNLENAQEIKRNADTFVDAISAEDMGSLPDRSVLEAIQRLPGVSIERFAAADDPDHFSVEGSGAVIRGMSATRSEFNGRDSFSANSGRGLSFQDVPPELMGSVQIFKNQSADMIEGGIGGTVSLHTRKPFDQPGRIFAVNVEGTYGDIAEEWTPTVSALFSDRWETSAGEFGFLLNASHSELVGVSHGIQSDVYKRYSASEIAGAENFVGSDGEGTVWMPQGSNLTMKEDNRERRGLATSLQWQDRDSKYRVTAEYIRSEASLEWWENALKYQGGYTDNDLNTRPYGDTEFAFNSDGLFQSGFLSHANNAWRATGQVGPDGAEVNTRYPNPYSGMPSGEGQVGGVSHFGHKFQSDTRGVNSRSLVEDMSLNFRWTPNDVWTVDVDYQHIAAESQEDDLIMHLGVAALQKFDLSGSTPHLQLIDPWNGIRDANPDAYNNGVLRPGWTNDPQGDANYFQDKTSYWYRSAMDHYDRSEGTSDAFRVDVNYAMHDSVITDVKAGVRWAEREQTIRRTSWNWGAIAPEWSSGTLYLDHVEEQSDWASLVDWSNFHRGGVLDIQGGNQLYHIDRDVVAHHRDNRVCQGEGIQYSQGGSWVPYKCREGVDSEFGIFTPNEVSNTTETNNAAYVRLDFALEDLPMRVAGNVGLRYVELERKAAGFVQSPNVDEDFDASRQLPADLTAPLTGATVLDYAQAQVDAGAYESLDAFYTAEENEWIGENFWYLSDEERAFATTGSGVLTAVDNYDTWLPSLNVKVELTDDLIARFAASKAIAMPDMGNVRNTINTGAVINTVRGVPADPDNAEEYESAIQTAEVVDWTGSGGNPYLKPMESIQYDVSLEWYFAPTGSLTGTVFYKDLSNFFVHGASRQAVTNPATGQTALVDVVSTRNGGSGEMYGFEIAHQQFFDMLPEPFDGFGVQANYTWIGATGVPNNEEDYGNASWTGGVTDTGARVSLDSVPLQGQSEHTANLVLMYEKADWSARLAYNWRSKYLLTTRDVISKYPLWNDAAGFMDGSVFYHVNDTFTVGVQATNLLNTQSETLMILDDEDTQAGRSWFIQDRRVSFIARAKF